MGESSTGEMMFSWKAGSKERRVTAGPAAAPWDHRSPQPPHLHQGLQQALRQGPEGTPVLGLLVLRLRLLQQGIDICRGGEK